MEVVNDFCKSVPSEMFDWILHTPIHPKPAFTNSKLKTETTEEDVKYAQFTIKAPKRIYC